MIGVLALVFSQSQAFRIFLLMFTGIISIAVAHGVLLTPAVLGECRFIYAGIGEQQSAETQRVAAQTKDVGNESQAGSSTQANSEMQMANRNQDAVDGKNRDNA